MVCRCILDWFFTYDYLYNSSLYNSKGLGCLQSLSVRGNRAIIYQAVINDNDGRLLLADAASRWVLTVCAD
jgi:hypothetical protein